MEKRLVFFKGAYDTLDLFTEELVKAYEEMGFTCLVIDANEMKLEKERLLRFSAGGLDAAVTLNNLGFNLCLSDERNFWDEAGVPCINILMDHPFHYRKALKAAPKRAIVLCPDENHVAYLNRFYPQIYKAGFLPHAGIEVRDKHPGISEREIDILYAGGLSRYAAEGLVPDLGEITEFDAFLLTKEVLGDLISHPDKTTEQAIEEYLKSEGFHFEDEKLDETITKLRFIDSYAVSFYREQAVRLLVERGLKVTVFGLGWERCEWADHPNFVYGGTIPARQVPDLMNHTRIVLNTMTWFKKGTHDRVFNGMLQKAGVVTDTSEYMEEHFMNGTELCMFRLPLIEQITGEVKSLLEHTDQLQSMADKGYHTAKEKHTWKQRAEFILEKYLITSI